MHGLQHVAITTECDNTIGFFRIDIAVDFGKA